MAADRTARSAGSGVIARSERRTFPRMNVKLDARVRALDAGAREAESSAGLVENISGGGVLLRTDRKFERGTRLEVTFPMLEGIGEDVPAYVLVEVVLSRAADSGDFVSHCRFVAVSRTTLLKIIVEPPRRKRPRSRTDMTSAAG